MKDINQLRSIFIREFFAYFNSPIAYIFIVVFVILMNSLFMTHFFLIGNADMRYFFTLLPIVLCIFIPAITMRSWAEEKRGNTFELLLTFPMEAYKLVLGKFFAGLVFYAVTLASSFLLPLMLFLIGKPDIGPIIGGYLGSLFMGGFFLSIGLFISGLCKDQIVAFSSAMLVCFFFYLIGLDFLATIIDGWIPGLGNFLKINFGMTRHFTSFERGVIDNRDIFYFVIMTAAFLALNVFSIEDRMRPKAKLIFSGSVGLCLLISMIFNSLIMDIPLGRYDLTEGKLYTVTESTRNILASLKAPVTVKLYISPMEKMPTAFKTMEQDIKDRLEELKVLAKGKLIYKIFHMEVAGEQAKEDSLEEKLQNKGISPFQVQSVEQDQVNIKLIYAGISIAYKEKDEETIPNIVPDNLNNLEYSLLSKIYRMTLEKTPKIALVAPYADREIDPQVRAMLQQLGQSLPPQYRDDKFKFLEAALLYEGYQFKRIRLTKDEPLPDNLDTLIIVAPENLNDRQRYEINRFLHEGGKVLIAAQNYDYAYNSSQRGVAVFSQQKNLGINELLRDYGVSISEQMLMDNQSDVISIAGGANAGPFSMAVPVKIPNQIVVHEDNMNKDVSITGRLSSLFYMWGSALELNKEKTKTLNLQENILFTSSDQSWQVPFHAGSLQKDDLYRAQYEGKLPLAVLLQGQFPNVYTGKAIPPWPAEPDSQPSDEASNEPKELTPQSGQLLVIGCSKMFEEEVIRNGGMLNLFINSVDALTLGNQLISIRGNQPINRSIETLNKMQKLWYRFLTIMLVPILVILVGSIRAFLRRKEKEQYLQLLSIAE